MTPQAAGELKKPDPIRPLLGIAVFAFLYWFINNVAASVAQFVGRDMVAQTVSPLIAASIAGALVMAMFESRSLADLGLHWLHGSGRNLLTGIALGTGGAVLMILAPLTIGWARFETLQNAAVAWRGIPFTIALLFCGAMGEEIAFRGFPLQFLMRGYGAWVSILATGAIFGLLHAFNPGVTSLGIVNTAGFGILFGIAVLRTHDLWLPIGMHFGWNAALPILGVELSGFTIKVTGYRLVWKAGALWSGGNYGPEAGLFASAVLVLLLPAVWKVRVSRGRAYLLDSARE